MASSETEIAQMALDLLGDYALIELDDETKQARLCKRNYAPMRDATLRAHPWNCALKRVALAKKPEAPPFGFGFQYQLPSDCLRVLPPTVEGVRGADTIDHVVEGRLLLTDHDAPLPIVYIRRVTDTGVFDPLLVHAISARLAYQIAYNLTGSRSKQSDVGALYGDVVAEARRVDGIEGEPMEQEQSEWLRARL